MLDGSYQHRWPRERRTLELALAPDPVGERVAFANFVFQVRFSKCT